MEKLIVKNLNYSYSDKKNVINDISFNLKEGEKIALIGPNGSGKSTILLNLNGILLGNGSINIDGIELNKKNIHIIRQKIGIVFQDPNDQLFCPTVYEDIAFGPLHFDMNPEEINKLVDNALDILDIKHLAKRQPHHLSIGEMRRASIAAVLACNPNILAFDEPCASLDPKHKRELIQFIKNDKRSMIIATHDLDLANKTCNRVLLINKGKIFAEGETSSILENTELLTCAGL